MSGRGGGEGGVQTKKRNIPSGNYQVKDAWVQKIAREFGIIALKIRVKTVVDAFTSLRAPRYGTHERDGFSADLFVFRAVFS